MEHGRQGKGDAKAWGTAGARLSRKGCIRSFSALGLSLDFCSNIDMTKSWQSREILSGRGFTLHCEILSFIVALSRPSKGRCPARIAPLAFSRKEACTKK